LHMFDSAAAIGSVNDLRTESDAGQRPNLTCAAAGRPGSGRGLEKTTHDHEDGRCAGRGKDSPVTPDLSVLAEQLITAAGTHGVELTGWGVLWTGVRNQVPDELSDHLGALTKLRTSRAADPGRSP
jgi:hypothetical protein